MRGGGVGVGGGRVGVVGGDNISSERECIVRLTCLCVHFVFSIH